MFLPRFDVLCILGKVRFLFGGGDFRGDGQWYNFYKLGRAKSVLFTAGEESHFFWWGKIHIASKVNSYLLWYGSAGPHRHVQFPQRGLQYRPCLGMQQSKTAATQAAQRKASRPTTHQCCQDLRSHTQRRVHIPWTRYAESLRGRSSLKIGTPSGILYTVQEVCGKKERASQDWFMANLADMEPVIEAKCIAMQEYVNSLTARKP